MLQPKTYVFDFDSTLVSVESLDELARIALASHAARQELLVALESITRQGMAGELTFDASLRERLKLFAANRDDIQELSGFLLENISPSALRRRQWIEDNADNIYVISGGFKDFILPVTDTLGIARPHVFANEFTYDQEGTITGFAEANLLCKPQGKANQLKTLGLPRPLVTVGDGFTDYEPKQYGQADEFWCFTETITRPNAVKHADRLLHSFDEVLAFAVV